MEGPACIAQIANIDSHIFIDPTDRHSSLLWLLAAIGSLLSRTDNTGCHLLRSLLSEEKWATGLNLLRSRGCSFFPLCDFLLLLFLSLLYLLLFILLQLLSFFLKLCLISQIQLIALVYVVIDLVLKGLYFFLAHHKLVLLIIPRLKGHWSASNPILGARRSS